MSLSNKYNITGYQNNTNTNNINNNSSNNNDANRGRDNKHDNHAKIIYIQDKPIVLINEKSIKYFGYC